MCFAFFVCAYLAFCIFLFVSFFRNVYWLLVVLDVYKAFCQ